MSRSNVSRRQFLVLAGGTLAGAALAACVAPAPAPQAASAPEGAAAPAAEAVELSWWIVWGEGVWGQACDKISELHMSKNPNVTVATVKGANLQKTLTAIAGGAPPDLYCDSQVVDMALRDAAISLDDMIASSGIDKSDLFDAVWDRNSFNGKVYGLPGVESGWIAGLGWNKNLFEEAGLDPEKAPATPTELTAMADKITAKDSAGNISVIGYRPLDGIGGNLSVMTTMFGAHYFDAEAGQFNLTSPEMVDMCNFVVGFYESSGPENMTAFSTGNDGWTGSANSAFTRGVQGMILNGYWMPGELAHLAPEDLQFGYAFYPSVSEKHIQVIGGNSNVIPKGAIHPQQSFDLTVTAMSTEAALIAFDTAGGIIPSKSFLKEADRDKYPGIAWWLDSISSADEVVTEANFPTFRYAESNWTSLIEEVAFGKRELEEGLQWLQETCQKQFDQALQEI